LTEMSVELRGSAAWLTLNRPAALNSLTWQMIGELKSVLDRLRTDDAVRSVVVTGTGRAFCAGADLKGVQQMIDERGTFQPFLVHVGEALNMLEAFPKPTIAAVNGIAMAGGLELAMCCDFIVAASSARLGDGHSKFGLLPGGGGSVRLPRLAGIGMAKYLLYTAAVVPAAELVACGLVTKVVADDDLVAEIDRIAGDIAGRSPLGLSRIKTLVHDGVEQPLAAAVRLELQAAELHAHSHDLNEGLAAFNAKRTPVFQGR
jgi:enoyl-CoA hydratase